MGSMWVEAVSSPYWRYGLKWIDYKVHKLMTWNIVHARLFLPTCCDCNVVIIGTWARWFFIMGFRLLNDLASSKGWNCILVWAVTFRMLHLHSLSCVFHFCVFQFFLFWRIPFLSSFLQQFLFETNGYFLLDLISSLSCSRVFLSDFLVLFVFEKTSLQSKPHHRSRW